MRLARGQAVAAGLGAAHASVMTDCPQMRTCAMYPLLTLAGTLRTWQVRYCQGDFSGCERYKRTAQGREVPANLMPNGMLLRQQSTGGGK